mmetsp:Transcript_35735/g.33872  ORF Transcript_35735/g.33872 Transcript_35735/m.33872 type:complete len:163 (+) Transcript_35735:120-608(+)|eukprot:CAMPEP_0119039302 /NCGR_PEP_ID=MMETSP1177-20130426/8697_1 /TAXON_ID=2985 /ORGANISM="Ochromonas sp, Strain CCMP1899" /LENGTH=162 /DNA_ID=CAMNT_0007002983 /DNA_START=106 /DNA_END=594 /DNA_ORIENTATION=-
MNNINVESAKAKIVNFVAQYPAVDRPLTSISQKVGVEKAYVALTFAVIPLVIIFLMGSGHFIIDMIGFVYPMYASIKAIESKDKEDDSLWLTYWLVFCLFKIVEGVADVLISIIPFYFLGKMGFLIWCYYPSTKGAKVVYDSVIRPYIVPALGLDGEKNKGE